jgi:hypothetical protein
MRSKREKGYWLKKKERYPSAAAARARAGSLRLHEHTAHVQVHPAAEGFEVSYSVAEWYLEELKRAAGRL